MQTVFVGGASGVGASCIAVEIAKQWIIVDAGVRVDRKSDPLPDLALLEGKDVRAIFITHAHADHIGALPLVHQAFPAVPIFASRATGLLMEVMLADALKIMSRRAAEEMEIPLYPPELVSSMLNKLRPLPVGEPLTLPELPNVTIHASRAGHIAGAVSFSFSGAGSTVVISGDISSTPQRTVPGALPPPVERCDLLVLESTYGARLHPNRQGEESRLALAVAESVARGGHTLIPCFGLGRGQEILLVLRAAQEKGQIPDFPIYVDGLVRRICSTYLLLPEALPPVLQRQIRKGYLPFTGRNVTFVGDERHREKILAGPPACILSSSGMLTGGPSVWYAKRLASQEQASILITGYQDEEAPGKRLLDLAEQKKSTLELDGTSVRVACHVAKYSLSAHADGGELAAYAAALKPHTVALVHGDAEARAALRRLVTNAEVLLPENGEIITPQTTSKRPRKTAQPAKALITLPTGIGEGRELSTEDLPDLWQMVSEVPSLRIVTARELAMVWYGEANEQTLATVFGALKSDTRQRYFVRQHALEEAYRVRGQADELAGDFQSDLVGKILLVEISPGSSKPVLALSIEPGGRIRVQHPRGVDFVRSRYPFSAILDVLGEPTDAMLNGRFGAPDGLDKLVRAARRVRRRLSARQLAEKLSDEAGYTLSELIEFADATPQSLEDRLAVAKLLAANPLIFAQDLSVMEGEGQALYRLAPEWSEVLEEPEAPQYVDQSWLQEVIEKHLGTAPDLYKRSIDPRTGDITLAFHFPAIAQVRYAEQIAGLSEEAGVPVRLTSQPRQDELVRVARQVLPPGLSMLGVPSLYHESELVQMKCQGTTTLDEIAGAQARFASETGWHLDLKVQPVIGAHLEEPHTIAAASSPLIRKPVVQQVMDQNNAVLTAQRLLRGLDGYVKVGAEPARMSLHARFHFPEVARRRYTAHFAEVEAQTGWKVEILDGVHQEALASMARRVLPNGLTAFGTPSFYLQQQVVLLQCKGEASQEEIEAAQARFTAETGWKLTIAVPGSPSEQTPRMAQGEAMARITAAFSGVTELYRVGVDTRQGVFWLHFHFPDIARERYAALLTQLEEKMGWRVSLHPHVHQKALVDAARNLLPEQTQLIGKKTLLPKQRALLLHCTDLPKDSERLKIAQRFIEATGWSLQLEEISVKEPGQ